MDALLQRFSTKVDAKRIVKVIDEITNDFLADGLQKEDLPGITMRLMMTVNGFKKLNGPEKKKLVIGLLNHLVEQIDKGDEDTAFETTLKALIPPTIDAAARLLKANAAMGACFKKACCLA